MDEEARTAATREVDVRGIACPAPLLTLSTEIRKLAPGEALDLLSTDPAVERDVRTWTLRTGHQLEAVEAPEEGVYRLRVRHRQARPPEGASGPVPRKP